MVFHGFFQIAFLHFVLQRNWHFPIFY